MYDLSVVIPTYGREKELQALLKSLQEQDYDRKRIQVIIVDQNDRLDLAPMINAFREALDILHEKVTIKGIAHSKNIGIRSSKAPIMTFADDDSLYYPDTVSSALKIMEAHPELDFIYGRVYDREHQKDVTRRWSKVPTQLDKWNYHLNYSAITCFTRLKDLFFDEKFGVGSKYGTGEELNYLIEALKKKRKIWFFPGIDIWHADNGVGTMTPEKTYYYALGQGAIYRKYTDIPFLLFFLGSCSYQLVSMMRERIKGNPATAYNRWLSFKGRIVGFFTYK